MVLATGAIERPLVFGNNDLPGVMLASSGQAYANRYGVAVGQRVVICGTSDLIYDAARALAAVGAQVTVADVRHQAQVGSLPAGVTVLPGHGIAEVRGRGKVTGVRLVKLHAERDEVVAAGPTLP